MKFILRALLVCLIPFPSGAQLPPPQATVEFDWEVIEGAAAYEVELAPKAGGPPIVVKTHENSLSQRVPVGIYNVRIRSEEQRSGYFGKWSEPTQIEVSSKTIYLVAPANEAILSDKNEKTADVVFQWQPHSESKQYTLKVWSDNYLEAQEFTTQETTQTVNLPTGRLYHWYVTFEDNQAIRYQADPLTFTFSLLGKRLMRPEVDPKIQLHSVTQVKWSKSPNAESYEAKILRRALDEIDWQPLKENKKTTDINWKLEKLTPGAYRIEVIAHAALRMSSEPGFHEFVVKPTEKELEAAMKPAMNLTGYKPRKKTK